MKKEASEPEMLLPDLCQADLGPDMLAQLFEDIAACTQVLQVIPKYNMNGYVGEAAVSLEHGRALLVAGEIRALQIRYRFQNADWYDTLMARPDNTVRLVRMKWE